MVNSVLTYVVMIGLISLASWQLIISVEHMSLKEQTQVARGIKIVDGEQLKLPDNLDIIITLLMIYLANAYQLLNNNTTMKV